MKPLKPIKERMEENRNRAITTLVLTLVFTIVTVWCFMTNDTNVMLLNMFMALFFFIASSAIGNEIDMDKRILEWKGEK